MAQRLNYVILSVYGPYSWGKKKGHVNPKSRVDIRLYTEGRTVKETISDFQKDAGKEAIYKIEKVVQEDRPMAKVA